MINYQFSLSTAEEQRGVPLFHQPSELTAATESAGLPAGNYQVLDGKIFQVLCGAYVGSVCRHQRKASPWNGKVYG